MKIAQIILPGASEYERKSQRADLAALTEAGHEVGVYAETREVSADVAHVYGPSPLPHAPFRGFRLPYVANAPLARSPFAVRRSPEPARIIGLDIPESVEEIYWPDVGPHGVSASLVGTFDRPSVRPLVRQALARLHRTRDDVAWHLFDHPPTPAELASISAWVDPAVDENDFDGFVAEAMVAGIVTIAARTPINVHRAENGRTGILVQCNDANELTHAILAALFKSELGQARLSAARQTLAKFRPRQRVRALAAIYQSLLP